MHDRCSARLARRLWAHVVTDGGSSAPTCRSSSLHTCRTISIVSDANIDPRVSTKGPAPWWLRAACPSIVAALGRDSEDILE